MTRFTISCLLLVCTITCRISYGVTFEKYGPGVDHDISVISIDSPATSLVPPLVTFSPTFTFQNFGNYYEDSIRAFFSISDSLGLQVYLDSLFITDSLAPDSSRKVAMVSGFIPEAMMKYTALAYVIMAGDEVPFNDTLQQEFATFEYVGSIQGLVTDDNAGDAPLDGAMVIAVSGASSFVDTTVGGNYSFLGIPVGNYTVTACKASYFDSSVTGVSVTVGSTVGIDFGLGYPDVKLTPAESIVVSLAPGTSDSSQYLFLDISGTRDLIFSLEWPETSLKSKSLGDSLWGLDLTSATGDDLCLGVEFDGANLWSTGAAADPVADPNYLYKFDSGGALLDSFTQPSSNGWGWRDLCFDGSYLYAASGDSIEQIDTASGSSTGLKIYAYCSPCRGLAYDPIEDCFYTASYDSDIFRIHRNGILDTSWTNGKQVFGLAWDATAPDGPWLWVFSQDGTPQVQASQFNPRTGVYTGLGFQGSAIDPVNACAGGAAFSTSLVPGRGVLLGLLQDQTDRLVAYDIRPHNASWLSLSKSNGTSSPPSQDSIRLTFNSNGLDSQQTYRAKVMVIDQSGYVRDSVDAILRFPAGIEDGRGTIIPLIRDKFLRSSPNPFRFSAAISFQLAQPTLASLKVYSVSGQLVKVMIPETRIGSGTYSCNWNGSGENGQMLPSGIYLIRLKSEAGNLIRKVVKIK